jgi:hypothetical protein
MPMDQLTARVVRRAGGRSLNLTKAMLTDQEHGTYFAPPERADADALKASIKLASHSPVVSCLLESVNGSLAVLNEQRQIVALNDAMARKLGIGNQLEAWGLRPGEAFQCVHACKGPGGCGTGKACRNCGAAIATMAALNGNGPSEKICSLRAKTDEGVKDLVFRVTVRAIELGGERFLLFFMQDITIEQQRIALAGLLGASEVLADEDAGDEMPEMIHQLAQRLREEVALQQGLSGNDVGAFKPDWREWRPSLVLDELRSFFAAHPLARGRRIEFADVGTANPLVTDLSLLLRILCNMVANALEATAAGGAVKVWHLEDDGEHAFCVWNESEIPEDLKLRIFQRNFSTKSGEGRGIGTWSMKLLGEQILGGRVEFGSAEGAGTVFRVRLRARRERPTLEPATAAA